MTALTFVLGAVPLKSLRRGAGRLTYWSLGLGISAVLFALQLHLFAAAFLSMVVLIGLFSEFEELHLNLQTSAFFALLITSMLALGGFAIWIYSVGPAWNQMVLAALQASLDPLGRFSEALKVDYNELMLQLPSLALILWTVALYLSVLLEGRLTAPSSEPIPPSKFREELAQFRAPDAIVWIFIASVLGAFGNFNVKGLQTVSVNVLNVSLVIFFFQGAAVIARFFQSLRMGMLWQTVLMVFVVLQLFVFVSALGLVDHWVDFRTRLNKRGEQINREEV